MAFFVGGPPNPLGAPVTMVAPDEVQAALRHYRQPAEFLESAYLPMSPNARQTTTTDERGRFVLSAGSDSTPARYVSASSPTGHAVGGGTVPGITASRSRRSPTRGIARSSPSV